MVEKNGLKEENLRKIHVPIGIDIGAQSYEEIALSIMSEIVKSMKGGTGRSISEYKGVYSLEGKTLLPSRWPRASFFPVRGFQSLSSSLQTATSLSC